MIEFSNDEKIVVLESLGFKCQEEVKFVTSYGPHSYTRELRIVVLQVYKDSIPVEFLWTSMGTYSQIRMQQVDHIFEKHLKKVLFKLMTRPVESV